jgi:hypothetical protein
MNEVFVVKKKKDGTGVRQLMAVVGWWRQPAAGSRRR